MERSLLSSDARGKRVRVDTDDRISKLSNDLLLKILSGLSTKEAVRTSVLSSRWVDVWKETSHLFLDLRKTANIRTLSSDATHDAARSMTKVIKDHSGHLERCKIHYYPFQCEVGMVEAWIQSLIHVNHVKHLTVINCLCPFKPMTKPTTLDLPSKSFSHPNLISLFLVRYNLETPSAFNNSWNLRILKLSNISAEIGVFNSVLASCPSLEALVLNINCREGNGRLKIENRNLKLLYLSCHATDGVEVSSLNLDVLTIGDRPCEKEKFVVANPRLGHFHRNYWTAGDLSHTSYSISSHHQEKKSIAHELLMNEPSDYMKICSSLSASVDLTNAKEVEMLQEVLVAWRGKMQGLEIIFKKSDNTPIKEDGKFWEETKPFPNAYFCACTIWLCNFSGSKEEFALASRLITQGTVINTMIIKPSSFSPVIEAGVVKLKQLPKGHREVRIVMV